MGWSVSAKSPLSIDDLKIESFVTSMDGEIASRLMGGLGSAFNASEPDHTIKTKDFEPGHVCTGEQCKAQSTIALQAIG